MSAARYEQSFYEQFSRFQQDVKESVELKKEELLLLGKQNEILMGIYARLAPKGSPPPEPVTGVPQIDAALAKQKAKL